MDLEQKRLYRFWPWIVALVLAGLLGLNTYLDIGEVSEKFDERIQQRELDINAAVSQQQVDMMREVAQMVELIARDEVIRKQMQSIKVHVGSAGGKLNSQQVALARSELQVMLAPYWTQLKAGANLRELNLYLGPSSMALLRLDNLDRFGDEVSQLSNLVPTVMVTGLPASGFEISHSGAGIRAVAPLQNINSNEVIGAIELALSPVRATSSLPNQAVLLHSSLVNEVLWNTARQSIANLGNDVKRNWMVETQSDAQAVQWQKAGSLQNIKAEHRVWVQNENGKQLLLVVNFLKDFSGPRNLPKAERAAILVWQDITLDYANYDNEKNHIFRTNLIFLILAEFGLYLLFQFNRRHVVALIKTHSEQIRRERDISEQAHHRLSLALLSSESGFWEWDILNNRSRFSAEWRELCGLPETPDGSSDMEEWLSRVHPSDKRDSYNEMIRHIKGETPMFENEYRLRIADGSYKWIFTRGKVVEWSEQGKAALMLGVYSDITERKKNEIIVSRQQAALRALNEIASLPSVDAEDQLRRALAIGTRFLGLPVGMVGRINGNEYISHLSVGIPKNPGDPVETRQPLSNYFCEYTLRDKDVFAVDEIGKSNYAKHPSHVKAGVESYIGVPLWLKGNLYGALCFSSDRARHQNYDELDKDFMRLLARWVGVTLERWQYQREQKALLDRFEKLSNQLPGFLYQYQLHSDGRLSIPYASAGVEALFGISAADAMQHAENLFEKIYFEDSGWVGLSISQSAAHLTPWSASYRVKHKKQGVIWVHSESRPERLDDGSVLWHGFTIDITEAKKSELKLQEINSLREAIFDATSISIISTDKNGLIKTFNKGAEKMLGYSAEEVIDNITPAPFHLPEEVAAHAEKLHKELGWNISLGFDVFIAKCREGGEDENEWNYVRKDGSLVPVLLTVTALRAPDGEITGYMGMARDIAELKRIDRMKTEFISTVSHELRTPLTAISGALGIINGGALGDLPDTAKKMLNIAQKNSQRLIHLVNDLLDMEKLVAGKMHFDMREQPLLPLIQQSLEQNAAYASQYSVTYALDSTIPPHLEIKIDAQRLQQVMANFLSNASKFSPENSVVDVKIEHVYNNVRVTVTDRGLGIPDEFRARIFQKFSQADSSDTRQKGGTGLGLAICKEIVERMGGKIGFESEMGRGSSFYFEMPTHEIYGEHFEKQLENKGTGARILVVEDDPEVAELLATMLRSNNYRVDIAHNAHTALERLALYQYQAMTVDIQLPDMNGITLIKQLRADATTQRLPIIVLSANLDKDFMVNRQDPVFHGVQWLQKPQTSIEVLAALSNTERLSEKNES